MTTLSQTLRTQCRKTLLAGVALSVLLPPAGALAAEREGTVLFFSVADLQQALESINDPGEQLILQLSGTRYFVVFQAWAFFPPPIC